MNVLISTGLNRRSAVTGHPRHSGPEGWMDGWMDGWVDGLVLGGTVVV